MAQRWYTEAGKYGALLLASADLHSMNVNRPTISRPRQQYVYYPDSAPIALAAVPRLYNRPHSIAPEVIIPGDGAEGILLTQGSRRTPATFGFSQFYRTASMKIRNRYGPLIHGSDSRRSRGL